MNGSHLLPFLVGAGAGLLLAFVIVRLLGLTFPVVLPKPSLQNATCSGGQVTVNVNAAATADGLTLANYASFIYTDLAAVPDPAPPSGSLIHPPTSQITRPAVGSTGLLAVWSIYQGNSQASSVTYTCSGSSGGPPNPMTLLPPSAVTEQLEAVPRAYRVSPGSPLSGEGGSPAADVVGALSREPEAILEYAPEASTPVSPVWQARGGPGPVVRWHLHLLHRQGGVGAVLSIVCLVGGREMQFTWVTSDWRFHAANRLTSEASQPGVPALLVRPA
jgi:hypothetical protein